ncbi:putative metalloprotease CJM1_0395 family protein [Aestuariibacter salexigens]|uniref:putative metalloprotease CJM1_0395 family protein n=1 Tax=Aestuariibacter salexigens TaxID=226010 RepID=UPI0003F9ABB4|nr:putative metalloprotease CJM1_0395 family protein [Aestuariibacter salexigens]
MNIVTPVPTSLVFTTANVNTESARRDNVLRETVPQTANTDGSAAEAGLGSESDRARRQGQPPQPVTYERPQSNAQGQADANSGLGQSIDQDNADDPSAGRENAESRQQEQQERAEQQEIRSLKERDQEVRAHEQAHASVGGQYAGAPSYEFETGPDGQRYAIGGEVSIDISKEDSPEETLQKMQQVRAAALAPAEPSPQDLRVANEAAQRASEARRDIIEESREQLENASQRDPGEPRVDSLAPELDDIVEGVDNGAPTRSLSGGAAESVSLEEVQERQSDRAESALGARTLREDPVAEAAGLETPTQDPTIGRRVAVIQQFYGSVATPRPEGLRQTA